MDDKGDPFYLSNIDSYTTKEAQVTMFYQLPKHMEEDKSIVFRSKNTEVQAYIGDEKVYETDVVHAPFYNHSPGTRWNFLSCAKEDAGKVVELRVQLAYQDGRAKVDNFYIGDDSSIIIHIISEKLFGLVICSLILFIGILYLTVGWILNRNKKEKDVSIMYLALFAIISSIWSLLETNVLQLFSNHLRLIQVVDNMMLVLGAMPLFLYIENEYGIFRFRINRILCGANMAYLVFASVSQLCGLWDFHQTLNGAITSYGLVVIILVVTLVQQEIIIRQGKKKKSVHYIMHKIGVILLAFAIATDLFLYLKRDVMDRAFATRIGLLLFILCFGTGNIYRFIQLVKQGVQSEVISSLAYSDGLTEVGNRTAYIEEIQKIALSRNRTELAIVLLDINNLKQVNDSQGHQTGDDLIRNCAHIMNDTFGRKGSVYRIGGDEFAVLIQLSDTMLSCMEAANLFEKECEQINRKGENPYQISVAYGFCVCTPSSIEVIQETQQEADMEMYRRKSEMKGQKMIKH